MRKAIRIHYVYIIFDMAGIPRYCGAGTSTRDRQHFLKSTRHFNKPLEALLVKHGDRLPVVRVRERLTKQEAHTTEIALIAAIGRQEDGGSLYNILPGGRLGRRHSPEALAKMSAAFKGKRQSPEQIAASLAGKARAQALRTPEEQKAIYMRRGQAIKAAKKRAIASRTPEEQAAIYARMRRASLAGKERAKTRKEAVLQALLAASSRRRIILNRALPAWAAHVLVKTQV